eukprot:1007303-Prymnesium_polylepis.2
MSWTEHTSESGKNFYYDSVSGKSQWDKPAAFGSVSNAPRITLQRCADEMPAVAQLLNSILRHCGAAAIPTVATRSASDPFCDGGRGGAFVSGARDVGPCPSRAAQLARHTLS